MADNLYDRYSITRRGVLLDSLPMRDDKYLICFTDGKWVDFHGMLGEWRDSIPVTPEEAAQFCKDGLIPERVSKAIADDTGYYPDPWDDDDDET